MLGFEHVDIVGEPQNLCGATTGILGDIGNQDAAVLTAVDKHSQQHHLHGRELQLARGIPDMGSRPVKKFLVKVGAFGKFDDVFERFQNALGPGVLGFDQRF